MASLPSQAILYRAFDELNAMFFDNELPPVRLEWNASMTRAGANIHYPRLRDDMSRVVIRVSVPYYRQQGETMLDDCLAHEMIHLWQVVNDRPVNHGPEFKRWSFKVFGRDFSTHKYERPNQRMYVYRCPVCGVEGEYKCKINPTNYHPCSGNVDQTPVQLVGEWKALNSLEAAAVKGENK